MSFAARAVGTTFCPACSDLRHDVIGFFLFDQRAQALAVQHIDDVGAVGDLHRRGIGVAVDGDSFNAQTLTFDGDFFTQLAGA